MSDEQANSDPLPYTQVDRAVKPKATLLAAMIKTSTQHALGSLVEFWDLNGDPRELEALVSAGKRTVVLSRDEVRRRFRLASGAEIDPDDLRSLGILERIGEDFRVRGMSRYFAPVERRLQARAAASAGGKASAASRKASSGTSQPGSAPLRDPLKRKSKRSRSDSRSAPEADAEATTEAAPNTAVSGQRSAAATGEKIAPDGAAEASRHVELRTTLLAVFREVRGSEYPYFAAASRNGKAINDLMPIGSDKAISDAWRRALGESGFPKVRTLPELVTNFAHFVGDAAPTIKPRDPPNRVYAEGKVTI